MESTLPLNQLLGENIPQDISKILAKSGYDTIWSLKNINENDILNIEEYINEQPSILKGTTYENIQKFKFKPGHKKFLLELPNLIKKYNEEQHNKYGTKHCSNFAYVFKELIDVAIANSEKEPNGVRYSECIRYFATYIYLHCGKKCYETLCANLPLPKANTIRKLQK